MKKERHILVVDDNPDDRFTLRRLISRISSDHYKYEVFDAQDGEEAIDLYKKYPIDCAFIDFFMLDLNGLEVVDMLESVSSSDEKKQDLPIVMISGEWGGVDSAALHRLEEITCIDKGDLNTPEEMQAHIESMLRNRNSGASAA